MNSHPNHEGSPHGLQAGAPIPRVSSTQNSFVLDLYAQIQKDAEDIVRKKHRQTAGVGGAGGPEIQYRPICT